MITTTKTAILSALGASVLTALAAGLYGISGSPTSTPLPHAALDGGAELCDGVDNDGDGQTDEDWHVGTPCVYAPVGDACHPGPNEAPDGVIACNLDTLTARCFWRRSPHGTAEVCNGLDDDCDTATDESLTRACFDGEGTAAVGVCRAGTQACAAGDWGACTGAVYPSDEACNGLDDDCDGHIDEEWPELGAACPAADGGCPASSWQCRANGSGIDCVAAELTEEVDGDGIDNDCDGEVDEAP